MDNKQVNVDEIAISMVLASAARAFGVPVVAIRHGRNEMSYTARKAVVWFLVNILCVKWSVVAGEFGPARPTLSYHSKKHTNLMKSDPVYKMRFELMVTGYQDQLQTEYIEDGKTILTTRREGTS